MNKKRLIKLVRKYPQLYNPNHEKFRDLECRNATWKKIASKFTLSEDECSNTWISLKYDYQNFVHKLSAWIDSRMKGKRPKNKYEKEMFFLWKFIKNSRSYRAESTNTDKVKDRPAAMNFEFIDIEEYKGQPLDLNKVQQTEVDKSKEEEKGEKEELEKSFKKKLLELISHYPELYDKKNQYYNEPTRRGVIWAAISNEVKMQVFECIHNWFEIKTIYEFYITTLFWWEKQLSNAPKPFYEHAECLEFYKPFVDINEVRMTRSYYMWLNRTSKLQTTKIYIFELVKLVKEYPQLYDPADENCKNLSVKGYSTLWEAIAFKLNSVASICERVWLVLKKTYKEICLINSGEHKFKDVWFLECRMSFINIPGQRKFDSPKPTNGEQKEIVDIQIEDNVRKYVLNDSDRLALIACVQKYPALYNVDENNDKHDNLWNKIGEEISYPGPVCRKYWVRLRKYFENYEKKLENGVAHPIFRYYKQMSYLKLTEDPNKEKQINNKSMDTDVIEIQNNSVPNKTINSPITITTKTVPKSAISSSRTVNTVSKNINTSPVMTIQETIPKMTKILPLNTTMSNTEQQVLQLPNNQGVIPTNSNVVTLTTTSNTTTLQQIPQHSETSAITITALPKISNVTSLYVPPLTPLAPVSQISSVVQEKIPKIASVTSLAPIPPLTKIYPIQDTPQTKSNQAILSNLPNITLNAQPKTISSIPINPISVTIASEIIQGETKPQISNIQTIGSISIIPKQSPPPVTQETTIPLISNMSVVTQASNVQEILPQISSTTSVESSTTAQESRTLQIPAIIKPVVALPQNNGTNLINNTINGNIELSVIYKIPATLSIKPVVPVSSQSNPPTSLNQNHQELITNLKELDLFKDFHEIDGVSFDQILQLITAVKHFPALYDFTAINLVNKKFIQIGWKAVSDMVKLSEFTCKMVWKKLCMKYLEFFPLNDARKSIVSKKFRKIFDEMKFLLTVNKQNQLNFSNPDAMCTQENDGEKIKSINDINNENLKNIRIIRNSLINEIEISNQGNVNIDKVTLENVLDQVKNQGKIQEQYVIDSNRIVKWIPEQSSIFIRQTVPQLQPQPQPTTSKPFLHNTRAKDTRTNETREKQIFNKIFYNTLLFNEIVHIKDNFKQMDKQKFMKIMKEYKELYCVKNLDYTRPLKRYNAWKEISFYMENTVFNCCLMWEFLLKNFRKFKKIQKKGNVNENKMKKWSIMIEMEKCFNDTTHTCQNTKIGMKRKLLSHYGKKIIRLPNEYQETVFNKMKMLFKKYQEDLK